MHFLLLVINGQCHSTEGISRVPTQTTSHSVASCFANRQGDFWGMSHSIYTSPLWPQYPTIQHNTDIYTQDVKQLDSLHWFSHRRRTGRCKAPRIMPLSTTPANGRQHVLPSPCHPVWRTPYYPLSMGITQVFVFCPWCPWPLTFDLQIWSWVRFLYNASKRQVSSSDV